ncbi:ATP synthase subunit I [Clostridium sp. 1001271B_151109_B4]|uniref:ATP synthase subunit I n=1 Tax=Clostridium sp. 1001271B_151109_B4 TaxID=2787148 RepID=UPI0018AA395F|nr:ATP synthase subunit I [Clostridium sp. 1001271B_151109_B4]
MAKYLRFTVKSVANNDLITATISFLLLVLLGKYKIGLILLLGVIISMLNFIISAKITDMFLNNPKKNKAFLFPLSYLIRIITIVAIAVFFSNSLVNLLVFLIGFFIHYIILVITTIKVQKGSE